MLVVGCCIHGACIEADEVELDICFGRFLRIEQVGDTEHVERCKGSAVVEAVASAGGIECCIDGIDDCVGFCRRGGNCGVG